MSDPRRVSPDKPTASRTALRVGIIVLTIAASLAVLLMSACFGLFGAVMAPSDFGTGFLMMAIGGALLLGGVRLFAYGLRLGKSAETPRRPRRLVE